MTSKHAILGPSSASKWLACPPSARLEMQFNRSSSEAADEGTLAHSIGELIIAHRSKAITGKKYREQLAIYEQDTLYSKAMFEYCDAYAIYVLEQLAEARATTPDAQLFTEQKLSCAAYIPEGFGTLDNVIVADGVLRVIDLKYGKGVAVSCVDNPQLKIYALAALGEYDYLYDIHTIQMHIYQPRMNNISVHEMTYVSLKVWAENVLVPTAALAFKGEGEYAAGKHCQFCKAKTTCRANAEYQVQIACDDFKEFAEADITGLSISTELLTDDEIASVLKRADAFTNWVKSVKDYALEQALKGKKWPGFKLVAGKSMRKITDAPAIQKLIIKEGYDRIKLFKPQEMVGITALEELTGKKFFDEKLAQYTIKAPGAPALVDKSDKRPEFNNPTDEFASIVPDELG
jgi:hypothetical protein